MAVNKRATGADKEQLAARYIAESIIEKAGEADVPVYADSKLADTLSKLEIGEMIPPELYTVVAEILVFVDECDKIKGKVGK